MKTKHNLKKRKTILKLLQINALVIFSWSMFAPFVVIIGQERSMSLQQAGSAWAFYTLACGIIMLIAGRIEDGLNKHGAIYTLGITCMLLASIIGAISATIVSLYIVLSLFALGFGLSNPSLKTLYSKLQIKGEEASEWSWMDGGNMIIMSIATLLASFVVQQYGTATLFTIMVLLFAIALGFGIHLFGLIKQVR
jgi:MFS family permease